MYMRMKLGIGAIATAGVASLVGWLALGGTAAKPLETPVSSHLGSAVVAEPLPAYPSRALVQLIEAAAQGQPPSFLSDLAGRIPVGAVLVAQADQVDAGAAEGHAVPVTIWVDGVEHVAGLQGTARFAHVDGGYRVADLHLDLLPLQVGTWKKATTTALRTAAGARRTGSPFYGRFRFSDGARYVAVDAVTGQLEAE